MYDIKLEQIDLKDSEQRNEVEKFLNISGLAFDQDVDYTLVMRAGGQVKATCSKSGSILKCFAVSEELRGEGIAAALVTALIDRLFEEGRYHSFIFTKPSNLDIFTSLGYKLIHSVQGAALLENGINDICGALTKTAEKYGIDKDTPKAALVMNCNPFTLGHLFLIEEASRRAQEVLVFIVQEDRSLFPFDIRYELVRKGTAHLKNVKVIPGGEYIISSATFPSYFLRMEDEKLRTYTELDAGIFARYFCRIFNITSRFVGEEPYCQVTGAYNRALERVLEEHGVRLYKIERKKHNDFDISASIVRNLIKCGKLEEVKKILPEVTWEFLNTEMGRGVMERIIKSNSPH